MQTIPVTGEFEVGVKRFYLPIQLKRNCPRCDAELTCDLQKDYLFEPSINKEQTIYCYCENCDESFVTNAILKVQLEVGEKLKEQ